MPHLENCVHKEDGWCLDCIKELGEENLALRQAILEVSRITFEETSQGGEVMSIVVKDTAEDLAQFRISSKLINAACKRWLI